MGSKVGGQTVSYAVDEKINDPNPPNFLFALFYAPKAAWAEQDRRRGITPRIEECFELLRGTKRSTEPVTTSATLLQQQQHCSVALLALCLRVLQQTLLDPYSTVSETVTACPSVCRC